MTRPTRRLRMKSRDSTAKGYDDLISITTRSNNATIEVWLRTIQGGTCREIIQLLESGNKEVYLPHHLRGVGVEQ